MKQVKLIIAIIAIGTLASCAGGGQMSETQVNAMVDSIAATRIEEANAKAITDCESRMATEVKTMTDSILANKK
jgi:hypothetical protein